MRRGLPKIHVSFDLDADGVLKVTATEESTKHTNKISITNNQERTKEEIEHMVAEAKKFERMTSAH